MRLNATEFYVSVDSYYQTRSQQLSFWNGILQSLFLTPTHFLAEAIPFSMSFKSKWNIFMEDVENMFEVCMETIAQAK